MTNSDGVPDWTPLQWAEHEVAQARRFESRWLKIKVYVDKKNLDACGRADKAEEAVRTLKHAHS